MKNCAKRHIKAFWSVGMMKYYIKITYDEK